MGDNIFNKTNFKKSGILIILIAILAISTISIVSAADITISPNSSGGLKKTIETAKNGDTIYLENGVYQDDDNTKISISKSISIIGLGSNVVIDGEGKNSFFKISGKNVTLSKLKFSKGYSEVKAVIDHSKGSLTIKNCAFLDNSAYNGGAICSVKGDLLLSKCIFKNNQAEYGGAIKTYSKTTIRECTFTSNKAEDTGIIYSYDNELTVIKSTFKSNIAKYSSGGAIYSDGKTIVRDCTFTKNKAKIGEGGAIYASGTSLNVKNSIFSSNNGGNGGAIMTYCDKLTMSKSTFTNNKAHNGGAIGSSDSKSRKISGSTFTNNQAKKNGGAIFAANYNQGGYLPIKMTITNSKFTKNIAGKKYNTIWTPKKSKLTKKNVKISPKDGKKV